MPRARLGVVLLVPGAPATEIDGLRRALGDPVLDRIAPHVTLVPPVNVPVDAVGDALAVLRAAAASSRPFTLELGPPQTFAPVSPTLYLGVGGTDLALAALAALRDAVFRPPLHRSLDHEFVPHVTIANDVSDVRSLAARAALADFALTIDVTAVHLLEERHLPAGRRWVPVADAPFGPRIVVGRGGIELELTPSTIVDPEGLALLAELGDRPPEITRDRDLVVITARRDRRVVGIAWGGRAGTTTDDGSVVVRLQDRGRGIGRQLALALESASAGDA